MAKLEVLTGAPIPLISLGLSVKQPTIKEISLIGEDFYFMAVGVFGQSDRELFMSRLDNDGLTEQEIRERDMQLSIQMSTDYSVFQYYVSSIQEIRIAIESLFYVIFPELSNVEWLPRIGVQLCFGENSKILTEESFAELKNIITTVFDYSNQAEQEKAYNPANKMASDIAEKIKKAKEIRSRQRPDSQKSESVLADICTIVSAVNNIPITEVIDYTYPQLSIMYERCTLLQGYTNQIRMGAFGGIKEEDVIDWTRAL